uniref:DUF6364 family protein n=1 Tax=Pantoea sp. IMH TaxID=1267600 RepID=UPI0004693C09|nr:DUF6364 family protein [Pantoea sp. IMH]
MTDTVSLTLKIDPALKETLKALAQENQISLSQEVAQRLQSSLSTHAHPSVDSTSTTEEVDPQLSSVEIKQIRALLKKSRKKK